MQTSREETKEPAIKFIKHEDLGELPTPRNNFLATKKYPKLMVVSGSHKMW